MSLLLLAAGQGSYSPKMDLSIEGMQSQRFGVGVFVLLMIGIAVFSGIIYAVMRGTPGQAVTRRGERLMFAAIILGVVIAIVFASTQMLSGVLF